MKGKARDAAVAEIAQFTHHKKRTHEEVNEAEYFLTSEDLYTRSTLVPDPDIGRCIVHSGTGVSLDRLLELVAGKESTLNNIWKK